MTQPAGTFTNPRMLDFTLQTATAGRSDGVFTATLVWLLEVTIEADPVDMLPDTVGGIFVEAGYLPLEGSIYHAGRPMVTCRDVGCDRVKGGVYKFTANYSDENSDEDGGTNENPLLDRPVIKPVAGMITRAIHRDRDGYGILNAAKDPVIQSMEDNTLGFRVSSNVASIPAWVFALRNTCNASTITIEGVPIASNAARFILPADWLSEQKIRNDIAFRVFSFEIQVDELDSHYGRPMDAGFRELKSGKREAITEDDGSEPSEPVPLNADGTKMDSPTPETVRYLTVKKYAEADYSSLPGVT